MGATLTELLGSHIISGLTDKSADRRSLFGREIEILSARNKSLDEAKLATWVDECILQIRTNLLWSPYAHYRMGGLIAYSGLVSGCGMKCSDTALSGIINTVAKLVNDDDTRVRYCACEAMLSIIRVCTWRCLDCFAVCFDTVCRVAGDHDAENRQLAPALDRSLKEVVTEQYRNHQRGDEGIVNVVAERLGYPNAFAKQISFGWILFLDWIPSANLTSHISKFIPNLFAMLEGSVKKDLVVQTENFLCELVSKIERMSVPPGIVDEILSVLLKSVSVVRSKRMLFRWLQVVALKSDNSNNCADVVLLFMREFEESKTEPEESLYQTHSVLFASDRFKSTLNGSRLLVGLQSLFPSLPKRPVHTKQFMDWILTVSRPGDLENVNMFFQLELSAQVMDLVLSRFPLEVVVRKLIDFSHSHPASELESVFNVLPDSAWLREHQLEFMSKLLTEATAEKDREFVFRILVMFLRDGEFAQFRESPHLLTELVPDTARISNVGAMALALLAGQYTESEILSQRVSVGDDAEINQFALLFETVSFANVRMKLVSKDRETRATLSRCLLNMCAIIGQDSAAFTTLFNRLHLVNVFNSL